MSNKSNALSSKCPVSDPTSKNSVLPLRAERFDDAIDGFLRSKCVIFIDGFSCHFSGHSRNAVKEIAQQLNRRISVIKIVVWQLRYLMRLLCVNTFLYSIRVVSLVLRSVTLSQENQANCAVLRVSSLIMSTHCHIT